MSSRLGIVAVLWASWVSAAPRAHVTVSVSGQQHLAPRLLETTTELLHRIGVDTDGADAGLDAVTVQLDVQDTQTLVTLDRARDGTHGIRHVRRASTPEVHVEVVAHVVQSAVEALLAPVPLAEAAPALTPPPLPVEVPVEVVDAGTREGFSLALGGSVGGRLIGGETLPALTVGLVAEARWRLGVVRPGGWLSVNYTLPVTANATPVGLRAHLVSARLVPSLTVFESAKVALDVGVGGGLDVFIAQATSTELPERLFRPPRPEAVPVASLLVTAQWMPSERLHLFLAAGLDVDVVHKRFVADIADARQVVLDPWRARPTLVLGVSFDVVHHSAGGAP